MTLLLKAKILFLLLLTNSLFAQNIQFEETIVPNTQLRFYGFDYTSFDTLKIRGFLIRPKKEGKYPTVIFNRGGNREFGSVSIDMMTNFLSKIADQGFIIIGSQLRGGARSEGSDEFGGKDVNDVLSLIDVIKSLPDADSTRIGMLGISRGVMTNFLVLKQTGMIKSCISISGIADLNQKDRQDMEPLYQLLIPEYQNNPGAALQKRSPLLAIAAMKDKNTSHFIIHGQNDERVNVENALRLYAESSINKISSRLEIFESDNHGINQHTDALLKSINTWFKEKL